MHHELVSDPLGAEDLWADLTTNIELLKAAGHTDALVLFGFAWGRHFYKDQWHDLPMALDVLTQRVAEAEAKKWGRLGDDNLYITIEALSIRLHYSHESDIHLSHGDENPVVASIRQRWLSLGWLSESLKSKSYNR